MVILMGVHVLFMLIGGSYSDEECNAKNGSCQDTSYSCPGGYQSGLCDGPVTRKCCLPGPEDKECLDLNGKCKYTTYGCSGGVFWQGKCGGPYARQCCIPGTQSGDGPCLDLSGICQDDSLPCSGDYVSYQCGGAANRRCCTPTSDPVPQPVDGSLVIVKRAEWGARTPTSTSPLAHPLTYLFIHHTTGSQCDSLTSCSGQARSHQNYHMDVNKWSDIGYNFLIGGDGRVYEGRGWNVLGAHTQYYNCKSVAFSFIGDFTSVTPNANMINAARKLLEYGVGQGYFKADFAVYGHRNTAATECPGTELYNIIKDWPEFGRKSLVKC